MLLPKPVLQTQLLEMSDTVAEVAKVIPEDDYLDEQLPQPAGRKTRTIQKIINSDFFVSVYSKLFIVS